MSATFSATLIYLHGFQSSSQSQKAQACQTFLAANPQFNGVEFVSPDLPFSPQKTVNLIEGLLQRYSQPLLMGSSMGGLYAAWCSQSYACPAVLINPVAETEFLFTDLIGENLENTYTGEHYVFTQQDIDFLKKMGRFELHAPELIFNLLETGDEVLDYRLAEKKYKLCAQKVIEGGDHRFQNFETCLPEIMAFYQDLCMKS